MLSNCSKNLLNLKELNVKKIKHSKNYVEIYAEFPIFEYICPCCGCSTSKIHDHYSQEIKDIPIQLNLLLYFLKRLDMNVKIIVNLFTPKMIL